MTGSVIGSGRDVGQEPIMSGLREGPRIRSYAASARRITSDSRFEKAAGSGSGPPPTW